MPDRQRGRIAAAAALAYLAVGAVWVYVALNSDSGLNTENGRGPFWATQVVLGGATLAAGAAIGSWQALILPPVLVLLAVPAGDFPNGYPELPIWAYLALWSALWLPAAALGVVLRRSLDRAL